VRCWRSSTPRPAAPCKDSFASLDLEPHGFRLLFDALWFVVDSVQPGDEGDLAWEAVVDADDLVAWVGGWSGRYEDDSPFDVCPARGGERHLPRSAAWGDVVAGAIANVGPCEFVGISNVFATGADVDATWSGALRQLEWRWPGRPIVGYEHGSALDAAHAHGAAALGPLRIWTNG
jgi:hypothetical protein